MHQEQGMESITTLMEPHIQEDLKMEKNEVLGSIIMMMEAFILESLKMVTLRD